MAHQIKKLSAATVQLLSITALIAASLYMYNDWRGHQSEAAPLNPIPHTVTVPDPQGVNGIIEIGPDGTIKQESDTEN